MSELEQRVAARLRELGDRGGAPDAALTLAAVTVAGRVRRRRVLRRAAGAAVAAVLAGAVVVTGAVSAPGPGSAAPSTAVAGADPPELYEQPPQGGLAADRDFSTRLADRAWTDGSGGGTSAADRAGLLAAPARRRVVYAADVPGGHRWAVVVGRAAGEWVYAWFAGPTGADADDLQLAGPVDRLGPSAPLALMDVSSSPAPLVLIGRPGDGADWSAGVDRAADGTLGRTRSALPSVDGLPTGLVPAPVAWGSGEVRLLRDGTVTPVPLVTTGFPPSPAVVWGDQPPDPAVLASCLAPLGITAEVGPDGSVTMFWSSGSPLSSAEQAARDAAQLRCEALASGGSG